MITEIRQVPIVILPSIIHCAANKSEIQRARTEHISIENIKWHNWKQEEDKLLLSLVKKYGTNDWSRIAHDLHIKINPFLVYEHYQKLLLKAVPLSDAEVNQLRMLVKQYGRQWDIISYLMKRSQIQVINKYRAIEREQKPKPPIALSRDQVLSQFKVANFLCNTDANK